MTKLIAVDMDGTFLNDNKTYDKEKFTKIYQELERILNSLLLVVINITSLFLSLKIFLI